MLGPGLGEGLSTEECMTLLEERLEYILALPQNDGFVDTLGVAGAFLGITESEIVIRNLCSDILRYRPLDTELASEVISRTELLKRSLAFLSRIVHHAKTHGGWPLLLFDEWVLDFVIKPLGLIYSVDAMRRDAEHAMTWSCDVLEHSEKIGGEVPYYRQYLADLMDCRSQEDASRRLPLPSYNCTKVGIGSAIGGRL